MGSENIFQLAALPTHRETTHNQQNDFIRSSKCILHFMRQSKCCIKTMKKLD